MNYMHAMDGVSMLSVWAEYLYAHWVSKVIQVMRSLFLCNGYANVIVNSSFLKMFTINFVLVVILALL